MTETTQSEAAVWRTKGAPLIAGSGNGPLLGANAAVKDTFAVAGEPIGSGNPAYMAQQEPQPRHASAVQLLLSAGAEVTGIAQTAEFAFSLTGVNGHYGAPPNPAAPGRISGGSSSGSASAVALGEVSIGLGTDTAGSIRVPAAYQGLWGIRTTHGLVPLTGVQPLAQSFDTVGWMTRSPELLGAVAEVLVPEPGKTVPSAPSALGGMGTTGSIPTVPKGPVAWAASRQLGELKAVQGIFGLAEPGVGAACRDLVSRLEKLTGSDVVMISGPAAGELEEWLQTLTVIQAREAWANHGSWVSAHWEDVAADVGARFRAAAEFTEQDESQARKRLSAIRETVRSWVGDGVLALPSAPSVAPLLEETGTGTDEAEDLRQRTLMLTAIAALAGLPVVSIPTTTPEGLPTGLSLIGPRGSDKALIAYARQLS